MYELPPLPYGFHELEPVISEEILRLHYEKHHAGYVAKLNESIKREKESKDLSSIIMIDDAVHFNGGGHINHCLFWENLAPHNKGGGLLPEGPLKTALTQTFGTIDRCITLVSEKTTSIQGSGWGWLGYCQEQGHLRAITTRNHDLPQTQGFLPLLCIDAWEHAYYLQYKNARAKFVEAIWSIIDWNRVQQRYIEASK